ncbi:MAG: Transcriptional regulator [Leuconostoc mesenteroides]|uniref:Uncharacterized protein n=1 Tax=Leuconostoc mesenteroides subsp. mesenteroides (strain ATCC 8293 / DSM 20343 / BCRC 11652 / CCM 1803 / JCM 6124 / NCDO 523 / NBRC 100496 / NCIMB 8023 / NCTC 12954 / NRRL B-1118 / 37Y) TaxID=203120 RepID=Q03V41_LEUMM|nr:hypothetical protein LEUM_1854 [Leuconostoc mesenteroides subsp. mesenteroides ATCC 8293]
MIKTKMKKKAEQAQLLLNALILE